MHRFSGFTLVELAIALMVIGLLIGGVLKGQELIENARIISTVKQLKEFDAATMIFRNTYDAVPGDFKHPQRIANCSDLPRCLAPASSGTTNGVRGNGIIENVYGYNPEGVAFWLQLQLAGMISGVNTDETSSSAGRYEFTLSPPNAIDGYTIITSPRACITCSGHGIFSTSNQENYYYILDNGQQYTSGFGVAMNSIRYAATIDEKIDDGKPFEGSARVESDPPPTNANACTKIDTNGDVVYATERSGTANTRCRFHVAAEGLN